MVDVETKRGFGVFKLMRPTSNNRLMDFEHFEEHRMDAEAWAKDNVEQSDIHGMRDYYVVLPMTWVH